MLLGDMQWTCNGARTAILGTELAPAWIYEWQLELTNLRAKSQ